VALSARILVSWTVRHRVVGALAVVVLALGAALLVVTAHGGVI